MEAAAAAAAEAAEAAEAAAAVEGGGAAALLLLLLLLLSPLLLPALGAAPSASAPTMAPLDALLPLLSRSPLQGHDHSRLISLFG